jgi:hypothetical protein
MTASLPAALLLLILASPPPAVAQTIGERIPVAVKTGLRVSIIDDQGRKIEGRVDAVSEHGIRLRMRGGSEEIPVDRIVRIDGPDSLRNGALIGLGLGLATGVAGGALDPQWRDHRGTFMLVSVIGNGVIWSALGTGIDAIFDNRRTLYERGRTQSTHSRTAAPMLTAAAGSFDVRSRSDWPGPGFLGVPTPLRMP